VDSVKFTIMRAEPGKWWVSFDKSDVRAKSRGQKGGLERRIGTGF